MSQSLCCDLLTPEAFKLNRKNSQQHGLVRFYFQYATLKYHPSARRNLNRPVVRGSGVRNRLLTALASHVLCAESMGIETRDTLDLRDTLGTSSAPWAPP